MPGLDPGIHKRGPPNFHSLDDSSRLFSLCQLPKTRIMLRFSPKLRGRLVAFAAGLGASHEPWIRRRISHRRHPYNPENKYHRKYNSSQSVSDDFNQRRWTIFPGLKKLLKKSLFRPPAAEAMYIWASPARWSPSHTWARFHAKKLLRPGALWPLDRAGSLPEASRRTHRLPLRLLLASGFTYVGH